MIVIDQLGLRQDPFGPASSATGFGVAAPLRLARDRLLAAVRRGDPLTVLAGRPGMGKTLLLGMIEQACRADGIDVRAVARGDMAHTALGSGAELLLIDEADTINAATLRALAPGTADAAAPTMVFAAAQPALHRISSDVRTTIVDLRPLEPIEAREFLLARAVQAGRPDLFTPEALDIIVEAGRGSPRLLRVLAGAAMFQAVSDGVARITAEHAGLAAAMQGSLFGRAAAGASLPMPANDAGPRIDTEDRPRALVPPLVRPLSRGRAGALAVAASVALTALVMPVFFLPQPANAPSMGVPQANAASAVSGSVHAAASAFTVAPAKAAVPIAPLKASVRTEVALRAASAVVPPFIAAPMRRIATAAIEARAPSALSTGVSLVVDTAPVTYAVRPLEMGGGRSLLIDLLAATRLRPAVVGSQSSDDSQGAATGERSAAMTQPAATLVAATLPADDEPPPPVILAGLAPTPMAASFSALAVPAAQSPAAAKDGTRTEGRGAAEPLEVVKPTSRSATEAKQAADTSRFARVGADEAGAAKQLATVAKQGAEETRTTKAAAQQAKESARQAQAAKEAADQAKAAKEAADQAKSSREVADQAKAVKQAVEQAKAAKDAADQAKAAKEAAEQAKAAKDAASQAKAAKDAAHAAKEAAKAAKDAAKAAKDAVKAGKGH